jgi:FkbM family methyltransferase
MYYSQSGQDKFLNETIFKGKRNGSFLDIGANDGVTLSNTCFFERELNWKGICIEPVKSTFSKLERQRKSININCCISEVEGDKEFLSIQGYSEMLSGLIDKYDKRHLERIEKELKEWNGKAERILVKCRNINSVITETNLHGIDYCSIDTEGGEFDIVKSLNFDRFKIKAFSIENNFQAEDVRFFMSEKGYELKTTLEADDIYVRKRRSIKSYFGW